MTPEPGDEVRVAFTGVAEKVYSALGHPGAEVVPMLPVRLEGGQIVYVPLGVDGIEFTQVGQEAAEA